MKEYTKLLQQYPESEYQVLHHEWGQSPPAVYNQVVPIWNGLAKGHTLFIQTYKNRGLKSVVQFLQQQGLNAKIAGKGPKELRLIQLTKEDTRILEPIITKRIVNFSFLGKDYTVNVGDSSFATKGLDKGTELLLNTVLVNEAVNLSGKTVGDVGAGWGAISMVLATEQPAAKIIAFEKDPTVYTAIQENLAIYPTVTIVCADVTEYSIQLIAPYQGQLDIIVSNPPFHSTTQERNAIFTAMHALLKREGILYFVLDQRFAGRFKISTNALFEVEDIVGNGKFRVWKCLKVSE